MNESIMEIVSQICEAAMRINTETQMACWVNMSGHVSSLEVSVSTDKKEYDQKLTKLQFYYDSEYRSDAEILIEAEFTLNELNSILSKTFTKQYKAYCNLIDMSCSQVFTSEVAAQKWVSKMKRKYKSVYPIVGYITSDIEETSERVGLK